MINELRDTAMEYGRFYVDWLLSTWRHLSPTEYAGVLITIAFIGWLLMRNSVR